MASKAAIFRHINSSEHTREINGKHWVELKFNGGDGKYDFTDKTFELDYEAMTGQVVDGKHYLVLAMKNRELGSTNWFEFKVWKRENDKPALDKEAGETHFKNWSKGGYLTTILVDGIPVLEAIARVLSETHTIVKNMITVNLGMTADEVKAYEEKFLTWVLYFIANGRPTEDNDAKRAWTFINEMGLGLYPFASNDLLPSVPIKDEWGEISGKTTICFPFEGELPTYDKLIWQPPIVQEKKPSGSWGSGGGTTVNAVYSGDDKLGFIIKQMKSAGIELQSDDVAGILKAQGVEVCADQVLRACLMILNSSGGQK